MDVSNRKSPESANRSERIREAIGRIGSSAERANRARGAALAEAVDRAASGDLDEAGRRRALDKAHQLVGSAGTFGYEQASKLAAELERFFAGGDFNPRRSAAAQRVARRLAAELGRSGTRTIDLD